MRAIRADEGFRVVLVLGESNLEHLICTVDYPWHETNT